MTSAALWRRRAFTAAAAMSLALGVATAVLWVRSYWASDQAEVGRVEWAGPPPGRSPDVVGAPLLLGRTIRADSVRGRVGFAVRDGWILCDGDRTWDGFAGSEPPGPSAGGAWFECHVDRAENGELAGRWCPVVRLPHAAAVVACAVLPTVWGGGRRCRRSSGTCVRCGYDLRATPGRCPECGANASHRVAGRAASVAIDGR